MPRYKCLRTALLDPVEESRSRIGEGMPIQGDIDEDIRI